MRGERALKVVLVLVGLLFVAGVYPLMMFLWQAHPSEAEVPMMLSVYVTLGVFVLLAARNPSANRSLIAFAAWSSLPMPHSWRCRHSVISSHAENCWAWLYLLSLVSP